MADAITPGFAQLEAELADAARGEVGGMAAHRALVAAERAANANPKVIADCWVERHTPWVWLWIDFGAKDGIARLVQMTTDDADALAAELIAAAQWVRGQSDG